jgi:hypothetical protein
MILMLFLPFFGLMCLIAWACGLSQRLAIICDGTSILLYVACLWVAWKYSPLSWGALFARLRMAVIIAIWRIGRVKSSGWSAAHQRAACSESGMVHWTFSGPRAVHFPLWLGAGLATSGKPVSHLFLVSGVS